MTNLNTNHEYRVDLNSCPYETRLDQPLSHQDALADTFTVVVRRGLTPADLTGMHVNAYLYYAGTRQTLPLSGTVSGSDAAVTLTADCYAIPGLFSLVLQLIDGDVRHTVLRVDGEIARTSGDELISSGDLLPTLPELLEQIADMQSATADACAATDEARATIVEAHAALNRVGSVCAPPITADAAGLSIHLPDAADGRMLPRLSLYGMSSQAKAPAPSAAVEIASLASPILTLTAMDGTVQSVETGAVLRGVATTDAEAATYADADGQRWIADEVDFARGVIVRRVGLYEVTGAENWAVYGLTDRTYPSYAMVLAGARNEVGHTALCSHYPGLASYAELYYSRAQAAYVGSDNSANAKLIIGDGYATVDEFKAYLAEQYAAGTPVTVVYPLQEAVEEALDDAQEAAFAALRATAGVAVEAGGAWLTVRCIVDTQAYVDAAAEEASQYAENAGYAEDAAHAAEADHAAAADDCDTVRGVDVLAAMAELAGGIEAEASGALVEITDAAARAARSLVSSIAAVQEGEGDPSPDNVRPISGWDAVQLWHGAAQDVDADPALSAALPETVFGGSLDWTTGLLTVTHRVVTISSVAANAEMQSQAIRIGLSGQLAANALYTDLKCDRLMVDTAANVTQGKTDYTVSKGTGKAVLFVYVASCTTVDEYAAWLAENPITVLIPYASPYTLQLDAQGLDMLKGSNALWSDCGDTSVTYIADTKTYIDNAIAKALA